jgi:tellurite resistance protein TerC
MVDGLWPWVAFNAVVVALLALDLGVFHRKAHAVGVREAAVWSTIWISLALAFDVAVYRFMGAETGAEWLTGYLIEKSLSVDNIFVFVLIFAGFAVPAALQHRVLFWGILGALVMRGALIFAGAYLIEQFHWIIYVFGAFLVFTGLRMALASQREVAVESHAVVRLARRFFPVTDGYRGPRFTVKEGGRRLITPLLLVLLVVETSDLIFAVDSIPAIFAVTTDPFIVYTSNVCAILGLRSLYFLLAGVMGRFHYLKYGLSAILVFVGAKMLVSGIDEVQVGAGLSLAIIGGILAVAVGASLLLPPQREA